MRVSLPPGKMEGGKERDRRDGREAERDREKEREGDAIGDTRTEKFMNFQCGGWRQRELCRISAFMYICIFAYMHTR